MSEEPEIPVALHCEKDVAGGFDAMGPYDLSTALIRTGAIDVLRLSSGKFEMELRGEAFEDKSRAMRWREAGVIDLTSDGLHAIVQNCRERWQAAVIDCRFETGSPDGGREWFRPYEEQWQNPIDVATFEGVGSQLAIAGDRLFTTIFERGNSAALSDMAARLRRMARSGEHTITVNSEEFHIPWGMIYTHPDPVESLSEDGSNFKVTGFWGYQHILEQYTNRHRLRDHLTLVDNKVRFGAAVHIGIDKACNTPCVSSHMAFVESHKNELAYAEWKTKEELRKAFSCQPFAERVVYFLCHGEASGTLSAPVLQPPALELQDDNFNAMDLREWLASPFEENQPLVFINACRAGQLSTLVYQSFTFAREFLDRGAACVIGPQIEVPAVFAGEYGRFFFDRFVAASAPPNRVGPLMRDAVRYFWGNRNPLGLVYSLYAGADCHIKWERAAA